MGGEKLKNELTDGNHGGSPPHGQGKGLEGFEPLGSVGITPAWAGKSSAGYSLGLQMEDHPRVGREKIYVDEVLPGDTGSPPRGRGKACW